MPLLIPNYLKAANIQDNSLRYEWDDWRRLPAANTPDAEVVARLQQVSQRAVLAFACGTAEWIVYRFAGLCDDSAPRNFLEAAWAMIVDVRYSGYGSGIGWQQYAREGWVGPVKRPIKNALVRLESAFLNLAREGHNDPTEYAGRIFTLTSYVMTDPEPFKRWSELVMGRLEALYPRDPADPIGDVVPRQAVDPDLDFKVDQTEALINGFLSSLDYRSNKFLSPPEGMLQHFDDEEAFRGTPYVFDIDDDRVARRAGRVEDDNQ